MEIDQGKPEPFDPPDVNLVSGIYIIEQHPVGTGTLIQPEVAFSQEPRGVLQNPISAQQPDRTYALLYRTSTKDRSGFPTNNNSEWDI